MKSFRNNIQLFFEAVFYVKKKKDMHTVLKMQ